MGVSHSHLVASVEGGVIKSGMESGDRFSEKSLDVKQLRRGQLLDLYNCLDAQGNFKDEDSKKRFRYRVSVYEEEQRSDRIIAEVLRQWEAKEAAHEYAENAPSDSTAEGSPSSVASPSRRSADPTSQTSPAADGNDDADCPQLRQRRKQHHRGENQQQKHQCEAQTDDEQLTKPLLKC
ncbi:unnamed protein product [Vitrella brassicaformis CCMP3155]|uniref:Uncharacterized protein n=1 Tax=Vitrella brassicaformis (strain CCMP3155) TaxID=1169540 RepID=A0A0G4GK85_VITBC|nr:unnamed protein product [Vitrella brassicaformis CCMP3155]|mmetsp:Transcript_22304/g.63670  ORF Transcript_22304/g.63670 Transcript_22304/m.63670 type:complete len:179 (-) Transcript_22304:151-687(-)|eukprot:CEM30329.1 unnamed protein product [Vitrella brassicaformis CCMP3155]